MNVHSIIYDVDLPGKMGSGAADPTRGPDALARGTARLSALQWIGYISRVKRALFLATYLAFVTAANILLKESSGAPAGWPFLLLLVAGHLAGFVGILAYTGLLQTLPLHIAFPLTRGCVVIGILASSALFFGERIRLTEAAGVALVLAGVITVGGGAAAGTGPAKGEAARATRPEGERQC